MTKQAEAMISLLTTDEQTGPATAAAFDRINRRLGPCETCERRYTAHPRRDHDFTRRIER
jgi:hypothetical protein